MKYRKVKNPKVGQIYAIRYGYKSVYWLIKKKRAVPIWDSDENSPLGWSIASLRDLELFGSGPFGLTHLNKEDRIELLKADSIKLRNLI